MREPRGHAPRARKSSALGSAAAVALLGFGLAGACSEPESRVPIAGRGGEGGLHGGTTAQGGAPSGAGGELAGPSGGRQQLPGSGGTLSAAGGAVASGGTVSEAGGPGAGGTAGEGGSDPRIGAPAGAGAGGASSEPELDGCPERAPAHDSACDQVSRQVVCNYEATNCYCSALFASRWDCTGCPAAVPRQGDACAGLEGSSCGGCDCLSAGAPRWECGAGGG